MKHFLSIVSLIVFSFFIGSPLLYGMEKLPEDTSSSSTLPTFSQSPSSNSSASNNTSFLSGLENAVSFTNLPVGLINRVADYLGFRDQFNLAQTSREQLFLWSSVGRVPESEPISITTSDVTYLDWSANEWPSTVNRTLIVSVERDIEKEELKRLEEIKNLNEILHLHFVAEEQKNFLTNINLLVTTTSFSLKFSSLQSLVFNGPSGCGMTCDSCLKNFKNLVIKGKAIPGNWRERFPEIKIPAFATFSFVRLRPHLKHLYFTHAQLEKALIPTIVHRLQDFLKECSRLVEIRDNHLDLEGNRVHFEEPWYEGIDFILRPWTLEEDGNARIGYERDHFVPGPARIRHLDVRLSEGDAHVPWYRFFHFLSPAYLSVSDLLPLFRAWSTEDRLTALTRLIPESRIERGEESSLSFVLPSRLQEAFAAFWQREDSSQATASQQKEGMHQQRENTLTAHSQETSALDETIQVAASRYSAETIQVPMRDLIEVIRENAQSHPGVQSLLAQMPTVEIARETLLSWFREVMEHFSGDTTNETEEPNTAEILVGNQLMTILRTLGDSISS